MKISSLSRKMIRHARRPHGFSLLEMLIVLGALSSVAAMAFMNFSNTTDSVKTAKLRQDVAALNSAVRTYLMSGGDLSTVTTGDEVIAKLKTKAKASQRSTIAGLRGSMVDLRLQGIPTAVDGSPRATWDDSRKSFVVQNTGTGFREFRLEGVAPTTQVEETRHVAMELDSSDKWIWSFNDHTGTTSAPRAGATVQENPVLAANAVSTTKVLRAPQFTVPGALYGYDAFKPDMKVSLVELNNAKQADTYYSIANGPWQRWNGLPISIPRALTTELRAFSSPLDPDHFEQSAIASTVYETIFFGGTSSGTFKAPKGDSGLASNLLGGLSNSFFTFGSPATSAGYTKPNSLTFAGKNFASVAPDQLFELGNLTYYNGSTWAGTNATSVQLSVTLNLTTPGVVETLPFTFNLLSTTNKGVDPNADADYVYIPKVSTKFNTIIKGKVFYLVLSFGSSSTNGFTTIDEFHTHENKTMTGSIFGRFTTTEPLP